MVNYYHPLPDGRQRKKCNANAIKAFNATMLVYGQRYDIKNKEEWIVVFHYMFMTNPLSLDDTYEYLNISRYIGQILLTYKAWKKANDVVPTSKETWLPKLDLDATNLDKFMMDLWND